jgi:hypothetical protein
MKKTIQLTLEDRHKLEAVSNSTEYRLTIKPTTGDPRTFGVNQKDIEDLAKFLITSLAELKKMLRESEDIKTLENTPEAKLESVYLAVLQQKDEIT